MEEEKELLRMLIILHETLSEAEFYALSQAIYFVTGHRIIGNFNEVDVSLNDSELTYLRNQVDDVELGYIKQTVNNMYKLRALYNGSKREEAV